MNLKFDLVRLANEDVIATSAEIWGIAYFGYFEDHYYRSIGFKNGTVGNINDGSDNTKKLEGLSPIATKPNGYIDQGVYHIDSNGNIIEKCTHTDHAYESDYHYIELDD